MLTNDNILEIAHKHKLWLDENPEGERAVIRGDITDLSFSNLNLEKADFEWTSGINADFSNTRLNGAIFSGSFLREINFSNAVMADVFFEDSTIVSCDFEDAYCARINFINSEVARCKFIRTSLRNVIIDSVKAEMNIFTDADLRGAAILGDDQENDFNKARNGVEVC
jgi:uncharacterized protein YjbI with pentapeptide repeats